jgi:hypothetical protein
MTTNVFNDFWDEELRTLVERVAESFGADAPLAAVDRVALKTSSSHSTPTPERILTYRMALKTELRRLITAP